MSRDAAELRFELDYWQAALADIRALNDHLRDAADPLPDAAMAVVYLALAGGDRTQLDVVSGAVRKSLDAIGAACRPLDALIALAEGRELALRREAQELGIGGAS